MDFSKIESGKLTKKFFMGLPEKVFLVSNCYEDAIRPIFSEHVAAPGVPRQMQWEKIKSAYADQRHCDIFDSENDFKDYYKKKHLPMVLKSYNPKIDVGKVELFIKDIASMKCEFSYSPNVSSEWKILFGNKSTDYKIFIHYEDPLSVKIVLVSSMNYIESLSKDKRKELEDYHIYSFKFLCIIGKIEELYGDITVRDKKIVTEIIRTIGLT